MLDTVSKIIVERMISKHIINEENSDIYLFGLRQMILLLFNAISALIISLFFNRLLFGVLFLLFFVPLRSFAGGLHAETTLRCYLYSVIYYTILMLSMNKIMISRIFMILFMCITTIITFILVPVEDKNHRLDNEEHYYYRNIARIILIIEVSVFALSIVFNALIVYQSCYFSVNSVFMLVIGGIIKNNVKKQKSKFQETVITHKTSSAITKCNQT